VRGWHWGNTIQEIAIPFPNAEFFDMRITGFASTINIHGMPIAPLVVNGTYADVVVVDPNNIVLTLPKSIAKNATNVTLNAKFYVTSCFGRCTDVKGVCYGEDVLTSLKRIAFVYIYSEHNNWIC
jgi:hypothetical protein